MRERAQYEQKLKDIDAAGEEDADLEVWDTVPSEDGGRDMGGVSDSNSPRVRGRGDEDANAPSPAKGDSRIGTKRRRPPVDPFAGTSPLVLRQQTLNYIYKDMETMLIKVVHPKRTRSSTLISPKATRAITSSLVKALHQ